MDVPTTSITFTAANAADTGERGDSPLSSGLALGLRRVCLVVLIAAACLGMSTGDSPADIPHSPKSPMEQSYDDCMARWDLPVSIGAPTTTFTSSLDLRGARMVFLRDASGTSGMAFSSASAGGGMLGISFDDPEQANALYQVINMIKGPILIVDGVNYSQQYASCLNQSGYAAEAAKEGAPFVYPAETIRDQIQANNTWAACARDHGWLIPDSTESPVGVSVWPQVKLPSSTTVSQLRTLLSQCPNFDPDKEKRIEEWADSHDGVLADYPYPEDLNRAPSIGFQLSDFDAVFISSIFTDEGRPLLDRLMTLYKILDEQQRPTTQTQSRVDWRLLLAFGEESDDEYGHREHSEDDQGPRRSLGGCEPHKQRHIASEANLCGLAIHDVSCHTEKEGTGRWLLTTTRRDPYR